MTVRMVLVAVLLCGLAGCTAGNESGETVLRVSPLSEDSEIHLTSDAEPSLMLYVSNQSFEDDPVRLTLSIDGVPLVDGRFYVEGQHNWVAAAIELPAGEHTLVATSDTGATLTETFETPPQERRWAILDYWYYPTEGPRELTFSIQDEPVTFA